MPPPASLPPPVNAPSSHFLFSSPRPPLGGARGPTLRTGAEQKGNGAAFYHYHIRTWLVFRAALRLPAPWRSARAKREPLREQTSPRPGRPLPPGHHTTSSASPRPISFTHRVFEYWERLSLQINASSAEPLIPIVQESFFFLRKPEYNENLNYR